MEVGTGILWQWVLANTIGWALAWAIFAIASDGIPGAGPPIGMLSGGAVVGTLQWLVLRQVVERAGWSILTSTVGLTAGFIGGWLLGGPPVDFLGGFALAGLLNGIVQWLALRPHTTQASQWILASLISFALGGGAAAAVAIIAGEAIDTAMGGGMLGFAAVGGAMGISGGALAGALSGVMLARWLPAGGRHTP